MNKIHLVMPMAGGGRRFFDCGFEIPKPMIDLQGKPFFYWAVESINKYTQVEDIIFVVLKEHVIFNGIDRIIKKYYPKAKIKIIPDVLNGAVLTCLEAVKDINDNIPVLFNDCDHAFLGNSFYSFVNKADFNQIDGGLLTFKANSPNYSYVVFDDKGNVSGTIEKKVLSDQAICGAYYFKDKSVFRDAAELYLNNCSYQEFFMSGVYNELVLQGKKVITFALDEHLSYGTPEEYMLAKNDSRLQDIVGNKE